MTDNHELRALLIRNIFKGDTAHLATAKGGADLEDQLWRRTAKFRALYGPWLRATLGAGPLKVLDIGCGTGCSSVVLAELGHHVDVTEIDRDALDVAVLRARGSGRELGRRLVGDLGALTGELRFQDYDVLVFWASLEHMTIAERLANLRAVFASAKPGARLLVLECPNRLWRYDAHTSLTPFFHWLPDELILRAQLLTQASDAESLYRLGRGASFHEFQAAGIPIGRTAAIDSLQDWSRRRNPLKRLKWLLIDDGRHERALRRLAPHVHPAFFHEHLDICIDKPR